MLLQSCQPTSCTGIVLSSLFCFFQVWKQDNLVISKQQWKWYALYTVISPFSRFWSYSAYENLIFTGFCRFSTALCNFLLNLASEVTLNSPAFSHEEGSFELKDVIQALFPPPASPVHFTVGFTLQLTHLQLSWWLSMRGEPNTATETTPGISH